MITERIPKWVNGQLQDGTYSAYCPYCRWIAIYATHAEALAGGLEHSYSCERA